MKITRGSTWVLNFPVVCKKKPTIATIVCRNRKSKTHRNHPRLSEGLSRTVTYTNCNIWRYFQQKRTYLIQIMHSGICTFFPLNRSTVAPAFTPLWPLLWFSLPHRRGRGMRQGERGTAAACGEAGLPALKVHPPLPLYTISLPSSSSIEVFLRPLPSSRKIGEVSYEGEYN